MHGLSIHGPKHYSHISVSGEARVHAGDHYTFNQTTPTGTSLSQQVLKAFGPEARLLPVVGFAAAVVQATRILLSLPEVDATQHLNIKELAYRYEWLEEAFDDNLVHQDQCAAHAASPGQGFKCQIYAKSLLRELEDLCSREKLLVDEGIKCAVETQDVLDELRDLRNPQHAYSSGRKNPRWQRKILRDRLDNLWIKAAQETLASGWQRSELERQLNAVTEFNGPLARTLLTLFWSKPAAKSGKAKALRDDEDSVEFAEELAQSLHECFNAVTDGLLRDLAFTHMEARSRNIEEAFPDTYYWALNDRQSDGPGLRKWLTSAQGIYWITGKAGSGKSTLMKFLVAQTETKKLLERWSQGHELVISSFYFWYAGAPLQKSTEGLLRSILHQIIDERRALAKVAFPDLYDEPDPTSSHMSWTESELFNAFRAISKHKVDSRRKKFCLFIDGLDEYHGNHAELVQRLALLVQNDDIKLCVASRPWNAFQRAYEHAVPNLRLEDLSQPDILRFVTQKIYAFRQGSTQTAFDDWDIQTASNVQEQLVTEYERDQDTDELIALVVSRAEGVFLWVYLVVRSLLEGLCEGDTVEILRRRVKAFPPDLRGFFRTIYNRVDLLYKEQTNQYLKLALLYMDDEAAGELSCWLDFWLISRDASGLQPDTVYDVLEEPHNLDSMIEDLRRSLNSCCRDLLVLPKSRSSTVDSTVTWLHRTVYDFIIAEQLTFEVDANVPVSFQNGEALHWIWLARWRMAHEDLKTSDAEDILDLEEFPNIKETLFKETPAYREFLAGGRKPFVAELPDIEEHMSRVVRTDWSREHALWSDRYAVTYDKLLHGLWGMIDLSKLATNADQTQSGSPGLGDVAAHLVAYNQNRYVTNALVTRAKTSRLYDPTLKPVLLAAFGEHPARSFRLNDIDITLMRNILRFDNILHESVLDGQCTKSLWQLFWRKWALTSPAFTQDELARVWGVAKLILEKPPAADVHFCMTIDELARSKHVHCNVVSFLNKSVPELWLAQIKHLPYITHQRTSASSKLGRLINPSWLWRASES